MALVHFFFPLCFASNNVVILYYHTVFWRFDQYLETKKALFHRKISRLFHFSPFFGIPNLSALASRLMTEVNFPNFHCLIQRLTHIVHGQKRDADPRKGLHLHPFTQAQPKYAPSAPRPHPFPASAPASALHTDRKSTV